ncbi:hypothetical protein V6N00_12780 [Tersicoccus sp. MR15.9]|uniref:hypothetical protein n=1 Tax=Tersicoccus mangrovi TaxID=3121635 RepID=UPI002FE6A86C
MSESEIDVRLWRRPVLARLLLRKPRFRLALVIRTVTYSAEAETVEDAWRAACRWAHFMGGITVTTPCPFGAAGEVL